MKNVVTSSVVRPILALSCALACALVAACSSGGSANAPSPGTSAATSTSSSASTGSSTGTGTTTASTGFPTGLAAGTVAAPVPASFGSGLRQIATSTTPTLDGSNGSYPANATFPLIATSLQSTSSGLSAAAPQDATLTIISTSANAANFQIVIPSLNVNANLTYHTNIVQNIDGINWGYSYANAGIWSQTNGSNVLQSATAFSSGYETPASAIPTTGSGSFAGYATAIVYKPNGGAITGTYVDGIANLAANFSSGQVTGALTQMREEGGAGSASPWNDVSLNAAIAPGTGRFSGTTAVTSTPGTAAGLSASATGHIDGAFYGPAAQNIGAVWSLSDGAGSAIGALVAKH